MISPTNVTAAILAGGKSSRMGRDKALLVHNGKPFIRHIADALSSVVPHTIVISDRAKTYDFLNIPVYADIFTNYGPLAGIHSALSHATTSHVVIASCDTPFIVANVVVKLLADALPGEITIAHDGLNTHPLVGIYPTLILQKLRENLTAGERRVSTFLETCHVRVAVIPLPEFKVNLRNINTPDDYAAFTQN